MSTIAQENAAARARAGVRTVTHEELEALKNSSPTQTQARATATAISRTSKDVYSNPPDGYQIALSKLPPETPTVPTHPGGFKANTVPAPDGYQIALEKLARQKTPPPAPAPAPASSVAPDGYAIALDKQRKEQ